MFVLFWFLFSPKVERQYLCGRKQRKLGGCVSLVHTHLQEAQEQETLNMLRVNTQSSKKCLKKYRILKKIFYFSFFCRSPKKTQRRVPEIKYVNTYGFGENFLSPPLFCFRGGGEIKIKKSL